MKFKIIIINIISNLYPERLSSDEIKSIRKSFGVTQTNFADLLGVKYNTYRSWEGGYKSPSSPALALLHIARKYPKVFIKSREELIKFVKSHY